MARASAWGLGTALAYRGLDIDAQAELLALWQASRLAEGGEAELVLMSTAATLVKTVAEGLGAARSASVSGGAPPTPPVPTGASAQNRVTAAPYPDILRPRLGAAELVSLGSF